MKLKVRTYKPETFSRLFHKITKKQFDGSPFGFLFKAEGLVPPIYPHEVREIIQKNFSSFRGSRLINMKKLKLCCWRKLGDDLFEVFFISRHYEDEAYKYIYQMVAAIACKDWTVVNLQKDFIRSYKDNFKLDDILHALMKLPWYNCSVESLLPSSKYAWFSTDDNLIKLNIKTSIFSVNIKVSRHLNSLYGNYISTAHIYNGFVDVESLLDFAWKSYCNEQTSYSGKKEGLPKLTKENFKKLFNPLKESEVEQILLEHVLLNQTCQQQDQQ